MPGYIEAMRVNCFNILHSDHDLQPEAGQSVYNTREHQGEEWLVGRERRLRLHHQ